MIDSKVQGFVILSELVVVSYKKKEIKNPY